MTDKENPGVSESRFAMWRTIFALAHADHVVTEEEKDFMAQTLGRVAFSEAQKEILRGDIKHPQNIPEMFASISDPEDVSQFFYFARMILWADNDFDEAEQNILVELGRLRFKNADIDAMVEEDELGLELEDEHRQWIEEDIHFAKRSGLKGVFETIFRRFGD